jgi:hypothetical protein
MIKMKTHWIGQALNPVTAVHKDTLTHTHTHTLIREL